MRRLKKIEGRGKSASGSSAGFCRYGRTILFRPFSGRPGGARGDFDGERRERNRWSSVS